MSYHADRRARWVTAILAATVLLPSAAYATGTTTTGGSQQLAAFTGTDPIAAAAQNAAPGTGATAPIAGGETVTGNLYPWLVKLTIGAGTNTRSCNGTVLSADVILTAAHCVADPNLTWVNAYVGNPTWHAGTKVPVTGVVRGGTVGNGDWAVLKTATALPANTVALLPSAPPQPNVPLNTFGWGKTTITGPTSNVLRKVRAAFVPDERCGATGTEVCATGWAAAGVDSCADDAGGPLVALTGTKAVQMGVLSRGNGCAATTVPGRYTELVSYSDAIAAAISRLGGAAPTMAAAPQLPVTPTQKPTPVDQAPKAKDPAKPSAPEQTVAFERPFMVPNYRRSTSSVQVTATSATSVTLTIRAQHNCANHLRIQLRTPDNKVHELKKPSYAIGSACDVWNGSRSETYSLKGNPSGAWSLQISDYFGGESGVIQSWSITTK